MTLHLFYSFIFNFVKKLLILYFSWSFECTFLQKPTLRFNNPLFAWQKLRELAKPDIAKEPQALEFVPLPD